MITPGRISLLASPQNQVRVWDGSDWVLRTVFVWDGSAFDDSEFIKVWDGSSWVLVKL